MKNSDSKRIIVITGGANGIGFEIAQRFASNGDIVVLFDYDKNAGHSAVRSLQQKNFQAFYCDTDVAKSDSVTHSIEWVMQQHSGIDILASIPLGRLIEPAEIAEAVFFLASKNSGMITGAVLDINGGVYMA